MGRIYYTINKNDSFEDEELGISQDVVSYVELLYKEAMLGRADRICFRCIPNGEAYSSIIKSRFILRKSHLVNYLPILNYQKIIFGLDIFENRLAQRYEPILIILKKPKILCKAIMETFPRAFGECSRITINYNLKEYKWRY